jgi:C-terminal processing protease CtpA/Prc
MGQTNQKAAKPSVSLHLRDKTELAGVGVIFRKNPEGMLVVKDVVGGSSADESGLIEPGDVLTQVDDVKVARSSIADISGMVLGTPGDSVKLKFTRTVGKAKKKYKVVLKRSVRASLEPTYHVQRDGINTKVTHIHLDCLQNAEPNAPAKEAPNEVCGPCVCE